MFRSVICEVQEVVAWHFSETRQWRARTIKRDEMCYYYSPDDQTWHDRLRERRYVARHRTVPWALSPAVSLGSTQRRKLSNIPLQQITSFSDRIFFYLQTEPFVSVNFHDFCESRNERKTWRDIVLVPRAHRWSMGGPERVGCAASPPPAAASSSSPQSCLPSPFLFAEQENRDTIFSSVTKIMPGYAQLQIVQNVR